MSRSILFRILLLFMLVRSVGATAQQGVVPSMGTEFWLGFLQNYTGAQRLDIFISGQVNTSGTVTMPLVGWSQPFTVTANQTTTVTIPVALAEHTTSEVIENKSILIQTNDTVAVFAINFQSFTADGSQVFPIQSLGTEYRVQSYKGLGSFSPGYSSELLVVSTKDDTQVEITPTATTLGGRPPGVPFIVDLDSGQTYQVQADNPQDDLTGTTVVGTDSSGACRPFAVFSGVVCTNIPAGCTACDHVFGQNLPRNVWGTTYFSVPFNTTTGYTYRILADENGTSVTVNGGAPLAMNAGDVVEVNNFAGAACFESNKPINVAQLMEGSSCSGNGDPALLILNAAEQSIDNVSFATVVSTVINQHFLNVIVETASIPTVSLDGNPIPPGQFTTFTANPLYSWASLSIAAGSHTLNCPDGLIGYVYGMGGYESYAYSTGSFTPVPPLVVDSVDCVNPGNGQITLASPIPLFAPYWTLLSNPNDTLAYGNSYTFQPTVSDVYVVHGQQFISQCTDEYLFSIELTTPIFTDPTINGQPAASIQVCAYTPVQLGVDVTPPSSTYNYSWSPAATLDDPTSATPIATPASDTWYYVEVSTLNSCSVAYDSIFVDVVGGDVLAFDAEAQDVALCLGDSTQLDAVIQQIIASDDFNAGTGTLWGALQNGTTSTACGSITGDALYFDGAGQRSATTVALDVSAGGSVQFVLKIGDGVAPCENADPGDDVVLEYSVNGGGTWTLMNTYWEFLYPTFTTITEAIPTLAMTPNTLFRWRQLNNGGAGEDNWSLEDVAIAVVDNTGLTFTWTPSAQVSDPAIKDPMAYPTGTGWFVLAFDDGQTGCSYSDSVRIDVDLPFSIDVTPDTTICDIAGIQLDAVPSSGSNHTWLWTPGATLNADFLQDPVATPNVTTTYNVTVTTGFGCVETDSVTITVNQLLGLTATSSLNNLCLGDSTELDAQISGSATDLVFSWTPAGSVDQPTAQTSWAHPVTTTNYIVTVTDTITQCSLIDSILVDVTSLYGISTTADTTLCSSIGLPLQVVHNVPNAIIQWSPPQFLAGANTANPTVTADTTAQYAVQVTDPQGCSAFDTVNVEVVFSSLTFFSDTSICAGDSVVIDAGFPNADHTWSTGATTQSITVFSAGAYSVVMLDVLSSCQSTFTTNVTVDPLPVVDLGPDTSLCIGQNWILDAGNPGAQYLWNNAATSQTITVTNDSTYSVMVTDANACVQRDSILVTFDPLPVIPISDATVCVSDTVVLDAGNPGSSYVWSTNETTQSIEVMVNSGVYSVVVTTPTICIDSADVQITFIPFPVVDLGPDTALCDTEQITLDAGNPGETFQWWDGSTSQTVTLYESADAWVSVYNGYCTTYDSVDVVFNPLPIPQLSEELTTCFDLPPHHLPLDAGNPECSFVWSNGDTAQVTLADAYGTYVVTITTPFECSIDDEVLIREYCPSALYVPNTFTPDGDGVNDLFFAMGNNLVDMELSIFDRWGELIYSGENAFAFWNGESNGSPVQDGVYIWKLNYRFMVDVNGTLGPEYEEMGHVTVVR